MSDEEKKDDRGVPELLLSYAKKLLGRDVVVMLAAISAIGYVTLKGRDSMAQSNQVQIDAGIKSAVDETHRVNAALESHLKDDAEYKRADQQWKAEMAADNRALYKAVMTGERQYRLERPLPVVPDGGP